MLIIYVSTSLSFLKIIFNESFYIAKEENNAEMYEFSYLSARPSSLRTKFLYGQQRA